MHATAYTASRKCMPRHSLQDMRLQDISYNMTQQGENSLFDRLMAIKPENLSANAWAVNAGVSRAVFNDIRRRNNANHETIEKLLDAIGVSWAQFDAGKAPDKTPVQSERVRSPIAEWRAPDRPRDVPVLGTAACAELSFGTNGDSVDIETMEIDHDEVIDYLRRPLALMDRRDVYAIYFTGYSMAPKFEPGEPAYVDPKRAPQVMDYAIIQLRTTDSEEEERVFAVMAKRIVRQTASYIELEQFNPAATFRVDRKAVKSLHRIIPWAELTAM